MENNEVLGTNSTQLPSVESVEPHTPPADAAPVEQLAAVPIATSHLRVQVEVPPGTRVQVDVEARAADGSLVGCETLIFGDDSGAGNARAARSVGSLPWPARPVPVVERLAVLWRTAVDSLPMTLFWLALGIYAFTRLYALPSFPIYFFTDEAVQTVTAADFLRDHLQGPTGELLPTYFENGSQYNLSASVYLQVLPYMFFGKSVWVTRGIAALMTLLGAVSVGLILKRIFKSRFPWLAVMFLSITPAWFLHSRTAFETGLAASFYAAFLYCYMMYRAENPRYLYAAVVMGALAFYSYTPVRMVMLVTALLLILSDFKYHWQHWKVVLICLGLALLLAVPFFRFLINHPGASDWQMRLLGSYWILDIPLLDKLKNFALEYLRGLDPLYWYLPNEQDLPRHLMLGYGHLLRQTFPLGLLGIGLVLRRFRSSPHRVLLIALLAAPSGAALVKLGITRALIMVIPMALLTALGATSLFEWLSRQKVNRTLIAVTGFAILALVNIYMLQDALVNGPLWYRDYGLTGMQYGGQQVFGEIARILKEKPDTHIVLSPSWANGTDEIARFFFPDPLPFEMASATSYFNEVRPLDEHTLFVMIPEEFDQIPKSRFADIKVEETLPYPDGRPGFYFVRLTYVPNIEKVIRQEESTRRQPKEAQVVIDGQEVKVSYTPLDMGQIADLFDGRLETIARSQAINPMQLTLDFPNPRAINSVTLRIGGTATTIHIMAWQNSPDSPVEADQVLPEAPLPRNVTIALPSQVNAMRLMIDIKNTNDPPDGNVHLWEVILK